MQTLTHFQKWNVESWCPLSHSLQNKECGHLLPLPTHFISWTLKVGICHSLQIWTSRISQPSHSLLSRLSPSLHFTITTHSLMRISCRLIRQYTLSGQANHLIEGPSRTNCDSSVLDWQYPEWQSGGVMHRCHDSETHIICPMSGFRIMLCLDILGFKSDWSTP